MRFEGFFEGVVLCYYLSVSRHCCKDGSCPAADGDSRTSDLHADH